MFDNIVLFVHIVQHQGLAGAARELAIPAATITRRLQKLEHSLGCQLIHRSARQFVLTPEGEAYYQAYAELVTQFEMTQRNLSLEMREMSGRLKVLTPTNISIGILQPMWASFIKTYPDIQLDLSLNNRFEDMLSSQADMALRIGPQQDSLLYQKRLGSLPTVLVAAADYLQQHGKPQQLDELRRHKLIGDRTVPVWRLFNALTSKEQALHPRFSTQANDVNLLAQFARDGLGIALLPISEVQDYLESGRLQRILPTWRGPNRDIFAVWPSGRLLSAKARCLRDYMEGYVSVNLSGMELAGMELGEGDVEG